MTTEILILRIRSPSYAAATTPFDLTWADRRFLAALLSAITAAYPGFAGSGPPG
jgi:hypothetical protein